MNQDELPFRDFTVEGYKGIRHLRLPELGRVNLFVGQNNAGKTSLLEAIRIHGELHPVSVLWELLRQRSEYNTFRRSLLRGDQQISEDELTEAVRAVESLFTRDAKSRISPRAEFTGGLVTSTTRLLLPWWKSEPLENGEPTFFGSEDDPIVSVERDGTITALSLKGFFGMLRPGDEDVAAIGPGGFDGRTILSLWSRAAGLGQAPLVEEVFRRFLPATSRIHLLSGAGGFFPVVAIEIEGTARPIPLPEMGDGTRRVLGIVLAMINARGGVLLIDEVENGLHHTAQDMVWTAIVSLSEQLDVQVFATTHSWEAVSAFQEAANRSSAKGMLYRLEREVDGGIYAERYSEKDVSVAVEHQVEVR